MCTGDAYREQERRSREDDTEGIAGFWRDCQWFRAPVVAAPVVPPPPVEDAPAPAGPVEDAVSGPAVPAPVVAEPVVAEPVVAEPDVLPGEPELGEEPDIQIAEPPPASSVSDAQVLAGKKCPQ